MVVATRKDLRWVKEVRVPATASAPFLADASTARDRLLAALADGPRTVAQVAQAFGLSQPTVLEQVRRAVRDGLIVEVQVAEDERRFAGERYYAAAVPCVRQPDRELLETACRALAGQFAAALNAHLGDLQAVFALTHLAREGWTFDDLWPYLNETIQRGVRDRMGGLAPLAAVPRHGLVWVEDIADDDGPAAGRREDTA